MKKNILITSAGKRCELLMEFQRELKSCYPDAKVLTVDCNPDMAPACRLSDGAFAVPLVTSADYIDKLLELCEQNDVRLVIPTIDTELIVLSQNIGRFEAQGVQVMVSDENFIWECRDKRKTNELFESLGIRNPIPRDKYNPIFPMFAKPYDGSLSTNIHILHNKAELTDEILNDFKLMFMEFIDKAEYKEFTVDMYYGADHYVKSIVPRERIEIRSGEINKGATRKNYLVEYLKERMNFMPGVRGCICIQLFYREIDNDVVGIEINPRYGGGYPLTYYAGANFPAMMIQEYFRGEHVFYSDDWQNNTVILRYDSQVIFHET